MSTTTAPAIGQIVTDGRTRIRVTQYSPIQQDLGIVCGQLVDTLGRATRSRVLATLNVADLVEPAPTYYVDMQRQMIACAEHANGNMEALSLEDAWALVVDDDAAETYFTPEQACYFDTAHGVVVTDAEADAMLRGVR